MILVMFLMIAFIGVAAISLDFGRMYLYRTQIHLATDVGALAAMQRFMRNDKTTADDSGVVYTQSHLVEGNVPNVAPANVEPGNWNFNTLTFTPAPGGDWFNANNNSVRVSATYEAGFTFGRFFGFTTRMRSAQSVAVVGSVGPTHCVKPWAVPYQMMLQQIYPSSAPGNPYDPNYNLTPADVNTLTNYTASNAIFLKVGNPAQSVAPGAFYSVREPPLLYANGTIGNPWPSGSNYRPAISAPCDDPLSSHVIGPGDWLQSDQGNSAGPTKQGTADLCGVPPSNNFVCPTPIPIKMAMWANYHTDPTANGVTVNCPPRCFQVKYIGVFVVTGYQTNPAQGNEGVTGYFSTLSSAGGFSSIPSPLKKIVLVQ